MKKILPILLLTSACLASCGESSYYGDYKFLMGREGEGETRVSVEMSLKEDNFVIPEQNRGYYTEAEIASIEERQQFHAKFEMSGVAGDDADQSSAISSLQSLISVKDVISEILGGTSIEDIDFEALAEIDPSKPIELDGFYKIFDQIVDEKYGCKVQLGIDIGMANGFLEATGFDITDIISNFCVAYVNQKQMTLQMPVSLDDIQMQLAWYGTYIDFDPYQKAKVNTIADLVELIKSGKMNYDSIKVYDLTKYGTLPGEPDWNKRYGTHPVIKTDNEGNVSKNEISEMNLLYEGIFSNTFVYENVEGHAGEKIGAIYKELTENENYYFFPYDEKFNQINTPIDVILKKDIGILDYDFSQENEAILNVASNVYEDGSHPFTIQYKDATKGEWTWDNFLRKPFTFRDFHDIKVNLAKEK